MPSTATPVRSYISFQTDFPQPDSHGAYELGLDLGYFAATYWPSLRLPPAVNREAFFQQQLAAAIIQLTHKHHHAAFTAGFTQGFDEVEQEAA